MINFQFNLQNHAEVTNEATTSQDNTIPATDEANTNPTATSKIDQLKALLAQMESLGTEVVQDEITSIKQKIADEEAKIKTEVEAAATELKTFEQTFVQKYGQVIAHGIEIILLGTLLARSLGVL